MYQYCIHTLGLIVITTIESSNITPLLRSNNHYSLRAITPTGEGRV